MELTKTPDSDGDGLFDGRDEDRNGNGIVDLARHPTELIPIAMDISMVSS